MKLEYRYGQVYYSDLHPGDMIPNGTGAFPVDRVEVYGGWYCFYNFTIITKTK